MADQMREDLPRCQNAKSPLQHRWLTILLVIAASLWMALGAVPSVGVYAEATAQRETRRGKWIEVRLATQRLYAWQSGRIVMSTAISSGLPRTPTVRGSFRIQRKYRRVRMRGPGYDLPNVPYSMFFYKGYAIHGTYWHNNFGRPMSHGCVNLPTAKAAWLYRWAPIGTLVVVH
jgi:lipoprotein-anchoring transpeptidase ErfK/SrfK